MRLTAISAREAQVFTCLVETVVEPVGQLPAVVETDAVAFFDRWLARSPLLQRIGLRLLLHAVDAGPLLAGFSRRMRNLAPNGRLQYVRRLEHAPLASLRQLAKLIGGMATLSYYGDDSVMRMLGYDPDSNLARGRSLREREGRP